MPSRIIPLPGAVKEPVCSRAAEHSEQAASLDASELKNLAILTKRQAASDPQTTPRYIERIVASGRLRAYRPTRKLRRARQSDLDTLLDSGATMEAKP
jgi:excisionase family DNA binding protein